MARIIGLDPGLQGAIAWQHVGRPEKTGVRPLPRKRGKIDWLRLHQWLKAGNPTDRVFVERVASFGTPGKGESTSLLNYGRLLMLLDLGGWHYEEVFPQSWPATYKDLFPLDLPKTPAGIDARARQALRDEHRKIKKARLVKIAQYLFPWRTYTSGEADALLICEHGRRAVIAKLTKAERGE